MALGNVVPQRFQDKVLGRGELKRAPYDAERSYRALKAVHFEGREPVNLERV